MDKLLETKAKFFDISRAIDNKDAELRELITLRQNLVVEIEKLEKE